MSLHEIVLGAVAAGLLAVIGTGTWWWLQGRWQASVEAPREPAGTWRILRTNEEVRAATERALGASGRASSRRTSVPGATSAPSRRWPDTAPSPPARRR